MSDFKDISDAIKYLDENSIFKKLEDDVKEITLKNGEIYSIKLKPKTIDLLKKYLDFEDKKLENKKIVSLFGIKVVISDNVEGWELK